MIIIALRNIICFVGIILFAPLVAFVSFLILCEDGRPLFFSQERLGINKRTFKIYKIRTMKKNAPQAGTHDIEKDFHLKVGAFIRTLKLDEFPQLINVIKGDINLVGPRPGLPTQNELTNVRSDNNIYEVKPGITGLSQILGYDMSDPLKLAKIDKIYIENRSLMLNSIILLGTFFKHPRDYLKLKLKINNI